MIKSMNLDLAQKREQPDRCSMPINISTIHSGSTDNDPSTRKNNLKLNGLEKLQKVSENLKLR